MNLRVPHPSRRLRRVGSYARTPQPSDSSLGSFLGYSWFSLGLLSPFPTLSSRPERAFCVPCAFNRDGRLFLPRRPRRAGHEAEGPGQPINPSTTHWRVLPLLGALSELRINLSPLLSSPGPPRSPPTANANPTPLPSPDSPANP